MTSFPVPNVQALASTCPGDVPLQYLRPELHTGEVLVEDDESLQILTIDMKKLMLDDDEDDEMGQLHLACKEWGFFQIMSNGEYKSIEHRAVVDSEKERLLVAAFYCPCEGAIIGPSPELMKENGASTDL